jgi:hypothetical protein
MPNPKEFSNKKDWMDACMHQCVTVEKKEQDQSVAQCLNQWRDKEKKSARKIVASFLEAMDKESGIWIEPKRTPRLRERIRERVHSIPSPSSEKMEPKPKEGDEKEFFENGKWVMKKFENGKWIEIKEPVHG